MTSEYDKEQTEYQKHQKQMLAKRRRARARQ